MTRAIVPQGARPGGESAGETSRTRRFRAGRPVLNAIRSEEVHPATSGTVPVTSVVTGRSGSVARLSTRTTRAM